MNDPEQIFVGRQAELSRFREILETEHGQGVLIVGQQGMGKTLLLQRIASLAPDHPMLKCACARYETVPSDTADSVMSWLMQDALDTAESIRQGLTITGRNKEMWRALFSALELIPVIGPFAQKMGDLALTLHKDTAGGIRTRFLETLMQMSNRSSQRARAVFMIDPAKYMQKESADAWTLVVRDLPKKVKLVFAQRPDDVLANSPEFCRLANVVRIPEQSLGVLGDMEVADLVRLRFGDSSSLVRGATAAIARYNGHPFATDAALRLICAGTSPAELPPDPSGIAATQWKEICKRGESAISLFEAYAVFPIAMPDEAITSVCRLSSAAIKSLFADGYLGGLIRQESSGKRIYHAILTDFIRQQIHPTRAEDYHDRLATILRSPRDDQGLRLLLHELRGPLAVIRQTARNLQRERDERNHVETERIGAAADQMADLLERVSLLLVSPSDDLPLDAARCRFHRDIILPVISSMRLLTSSSGLSIGCEGLEALPELYLDDKLMRIAVRNLVGNAVKYSLPMRGRGDRIWLRGGAGPKAYSVIVADQGIGIQRGTEEVIFERGYRGASSAVSTGLGLGLWIARRIIEAHGGSLAVRRNCNPTELEITLPRWLASRPPSRSKL